MPTYLDNRQRIVLGNLSLPHSLPEVTRLIAGNPYAPFDKTITLDELANELAGILRELEAEGLAENLGVGSDTAAIADKCFADHLPTIPAEKLEQWTDQMAGRSGFKLREGELWYWTAAGRELLTSS